MSVEKKEAAPESRLQWLDEELGKVKAAVQKVEHELQQALIQIRNLDSGVSKLEQSGGDTGGASGPLAGVQEEVRQLRSQTGRLQDRQNLLAVNDKVLGAMRAQSTLRRFDREVSRWRADYPGQAAFLRVDRLVRYGTVIRVMARLNRMGIVEVGLMIEEEAN